MANTRVLRVTGPVILDWGNGVRLQLSPAGSGDGAGTVASAATAQPGRRGRKPSPATQALIEAMHADKAAGRQRSRSEYAAVLEASGHAGSPQSASLILAREAKRVFGHPLGRDGKAGRRTAAAGTPAGAREEAGRRGRKPAPHTLKLREKLASDKQAGTLHDVQHYTRWLVDQSKLGLKRARPIVYRELRAVRDA